MIVAVVEHGIERNLNISTRTVMVVFSVRLPHLIHPSRGAPTRWRDCSVVHIQVFRYLDSSSSPR